MAVTMVDASASSGVVAVIPARGGSKGIPRKNLRTVGGVPLVVHAVRAALQAATVNAVFVSTEDSEIAEVSAAAGAQVIQRPRDLATDTAKGEEVLRHALAAIEAADQRADIAVLLQPTSPLRRAVDIDGAVRVLLDNQAGSVFSICDVDHHPAKCVRVTEAGLEPYTTEVEMEARRHDLEVVYRQNGAVYAVRVDQFLASGRLFCRPCLGYVMDREFSVDIDDSVDLQVAEALIAARNEAGKRP